jgi:hypothetical protein
MANHKPSDIFFFDELVERNSRSGGKLKVALVVADISDSRPHPSVQEAFMDEYLLRYSLLHFLHLFLNNS